MPYVIELPKSERKGYVIENPVSPKVNADEQRGRKLPSPAQGAITAVSNGLLGFGDELYGALGGLGAAATGNDIR